MNLTECNQKAEEYPKTKDNCTRRFTKVWYYVVATKSIQFVAITPHKALEFIYDVLPTEAILLKELALAYKESI